MWGMGLGMEGCSVPPPCSCSPVTVCANAQLRHATFRGDVLVVDTPTQNEPSGTPVPEDRSGRQTQRAFHRNKKRNGLHPLFRPQVTLWKDGKLHASSLVLLRTHTFGPTRFQNAPRQKCLSRDHRCAHILFCKSRLRLDHWQPVSERSIFIIATVPASRQRSEEKQKAQITDSSASQTPTPGIPGRKDASSQRYVQIALASPSTRRARPRRSTSCDPFQRGSPAEIGTDVLRAPRTSLTPGVQHEQTQARPQRK
ncbi:hypothetical protein FA95DRAFT_534821 [Auriscalpium vulgare]|uniref:Uncharacterized protein n=1 Tax=Auriscalpium vulgare TaxID=40419 RepID=A0ACB8RGL5_9AGAM|nr:hypothetical protein FA95DRAFT_534821 [Auriscalpium vulgare]